MILTGPFQFKILCESTWAFKLDPCVLSFHVKTFWYLTLHQPGKTGIMFVSHKDLKFALKMFWDILSEFLCLGNICLPMEIPARIFISSESKTCVSRTGIWTSYSLRFLLPAFVPFYFCLVTCLGNQVTAQSWLLILIYLISGRWRHRDCNLGRLLSMWFSLSLLQNKTNFLSGT